MSPLGQNDSSGHGHAQRPRIAIIGAWGRDAGGVSVVVAAVVDEARTPRRVSATGASRPWISGWPAVTAIGFLFAFGVQRAYIASMKHSIGEAYRLPTGGMAPRLLANDWIMTVPIGPDGVKRGAPLAFHAWEGQILIKRVVGLPGDTIGMRNDTLEVDGRPLREPYAYVDPNTTRGSQTDMPQCALPLPPARFPCLTSDLIAPNT